VGSIPLIIYRLPGISLALASRALGIIYTRRMVKTDMCQQVE